MKARGEDTVEDSNDGDGDGDGGGDGDGDGDGDGYNHVAPPLTKSGPTPRQTGLSPRSWTLPSSKVDLPLGGGLPSPRKSTFPSWLTFPS